MGRDFLSLFPDLDIEDLRKLPSPFYLYSEQKIRNNIQHLLQTGKKYFPDFHLHYALKANGNPHILKIFQQEEHEGLTFAQANQREKEIKLSQIGLIIVGGIM